MGFQKRREGGRGRKRKRWRESQIPRSQEGGVSKEEKVEGEPNS